MTYQQSTEAAAILLESILPTILANIFLSFAAFMLVWKYKKHILWPTASLYAMLVPLMMLTCAGYLQNLSADPPVRSLHETVAMLTFFAWCLGVWLGCLLAISYLQKAK